MEHEAHNLDLKRLSDRIVYALELAIDQKEKDIAEALCRCLEMASTRNAGGEDFTERRNLAKEIEHALNRLSEL